VEGWNCFKGRVSSVFAVHLAPPGANDRHEARCTTERNEAMKDKNRISDQDRLESLLKNAFNTQLQPLRSLETATKKRRAQKKKAANNSGFTKSTTKTSG
jgi:hypothetical protein